MMVIQRQVAKWQVMAEHVRRRVLEWKCETSALDGDFEVVQTLSELNLALLTAAACLSPTAHSGGNLLASLGIVVTLFMGEPIAASQWHSYVHLYTGFYTKSLLHPIHPPYQCPRPQTTEIDAVLSPTFRPASSE
jgi:hypothetical protein